MYLHGLYNIDHLDHPVMFLVACQAKIIQMSSEFYITLEFHISNILEHSVKTGIKYSVIQ